MSERVEPNLDANTGSYRIAIVIDSLCGGGAEKVMMTLAETLVKLGHKPQLIALSNHLAYDMPTLYPVHFVYGPKERLKGWFKGAKHAVNLRERVMALEEESGKFDLFLVNLEEAYRAAKGCHFNNCYYVIHNSLEATLKRTMLLGPIKYYYLKTIFKSLSNERLIAVSKGVENEINQSALIHPKSVQTIYNPFDIEFITRKAAENIDGLPDEPYLIHIGRVARQKRHDILFQALAKVKKPIKLVCLCSNTNKGRRLAEKYKVADRVIFPGFTKNPYAWIKNAEALVLSSDYEGFCSVLIESLVCGTVPVTTRCPHGPEEIFGEILKDLIAPVRDASALAEKIDLALSSSFDVEHQPILEKVKAEVPARRYLSLIRPQS